jgi:class 3 adenylate cyclase
LAERILASRSALEGERKTVTALFCDIVDSTATAERVGAEAMSGVVEEFLARSLAEVHRYEGTVTQFLGDGFLALFGAPLEPVFGRTGVGGAEAMPDQNVPRA